MYIIIRNNNNDGLYIIEWLDENQPICFSNGTVTYTTIDCIEHETSVQDIVEIGA